MEEAKLITAPFLESGYTYIPCPFCLSIDEMMEWQEAKKKDGDGFYPKPSFVSHARNHAETKKELLYWKVAIHVYVKALKKTEPVRSMKTRIIRAKAAMEAKQMELDTKGKQPKLMEVEKEFMADIGSLYHGSNFDVILDVDAEKYTAHRAILCCRSSYFKEKFFRAEIETKGTLVLDDVSPEFHEKFPQILQFIYNGSCHVAGEGIELLLAAQYFQLPGLMSLCSNQIAKEFCIKNVCAYLRMAHENACTDVKTAALLFIRRHWHEVEADSIYKSLSADYKVMILSQFAPSQKRPRPQVNDTTATKKRKLAEDT